MAFSLKIRIKQNSYDASRNSSNVTVSVDSTWSGGTWNHEMPTSTVVVDGTSYSYNAAINPAPKTTSGTRTIWKKTLDINHNSDGTKTLQVTANYNWRGVTAKASAVLTKNTSSGPSYNDETKKPSTVVIDKLDLQTGTDRTLYCSWTWKTEHTENYRVVWYYHTGDMWFVGSDSKIEYKHATYTAPDNAKKVKVKVMPLSEKYRKNDKETTYWTADWSSEKTYSFTSAPPSAPSVPTVTIQDSTLTAEIDDAPTNADEIEFQVVKNNTAVSKKGSIAVKTQYAAFSCSVANNSQYKVRCRAKNENGSSAWSDYSDNVRTKPSAPKSITTCKANTETSVYLEWEAVDGITTYDIEYATKKEYFDGSDATTLIQSVESTHYEKTGLETGTEYFFRVRAVDDEVQSDWSKIKSVVLGKKPGAPTTWSSSTTITNDETVYLYWMHNTDDGSKQTLANVELSLYERDVENNTWVLISKSTRKLEYEDIEQEEGTNASYMGFGGMFEEGVQLRWRVQTAGVTKEFGEWSVLRTVDIYARPTLEFSITNANGDIIDVVESFPIYVRALAGPNTQRPISYHVSVTSNEIYESVDQVGNVKMVNRGEQVYSEYFDTSEAELVVGLSANNIDLANNVSYKVECSVHMDSGLSARESESFTVSWTESSFVPDAEISIDTNDYSASIHPYCANYRLAYYQVTRTWVASDGTFAYTKRDTEAHLSETPVEVEGAYTTTGEQVFMVDNGTGAPAYYCEVFVFESFVQGITLSVYRREFDGTFTELATRLSNKDGVFITDPHPALDLARYRIVAVESTTGAISYYDVPGYPVGGKSVVIQWDEAWSNFDITEENAMAQPEWSGSMLKLPYNVDVSDKYDPDVSHVEYVGRKHPVSYHGTQIGATSTWNVVIEKDDEETLYALRRLAIWNGQVYVREPSGSGYWATVVVSFSQKHLDMTIPVTLDITRVEGGV